MLRQVVVGVVGFFRRIGTQPDAELLALLDAVGLQMGQVVERQQLAEELQQAQKMAAIGTLAGGIAHDFNNILGGIYGYCELAHMDAKGNLPVTEHLNAVMSGARRATNLVQQILAFSRRHGQDRRPIQLRHVTAEAMRLLRAAVPPTIEFLTVLANDVPVVLADETQVHQILMNLSTNAAHAMREHGGRLTVKLENCTLDAEQGTGQSKLNVGQYARLTVSDTGQGMDEQTLGKIFEPFYTTKHPGDGVGLGLAVVRGIVIKHKGVITVSSRLGQGTTFQVYFPAHPVVVEEVANACPIVPCSRRPRFFSVSRTIPSSYSAASAIRCSSRAASASISALRFCSAMILGCSSP
jgi:signal transduction histidine kinase